MPADLLPVCNLDISRLPEGGRPAKLVASEKQRSAIANHCGLSEISMLEADLLVSAFGGEGAAIAGTLRATVAQPCVVTLRPVTQNIDAELGMKFLPRRDGIPVRGTAGQEVVIDIGEDDPPEILDGSNIDLWAVIVETLLLNADMFPRSAGAQLAHPPDTAADPEEPDSPFAVLAKLENGQKKSE